MKIIILANNCPWASWPAKIDAIKAFYAPLVPLEIDIQHTTFQNVPLKGYPGTVTQFGPAGAVDVPGTDTEVDQDWFKQNIVPLIAGYDIAVFQLGDFPQREGLPLGVKFGEYNGTWCCETFVNTEVSNYYLSNPNGGPMNDLGDLATVIIEHEISHALYAISGQTDNTHLYFYSGQFARVLTDIVLPNTSNGPLIALYKKLIVALETELGILKQQQSQSDMKPITPAPQPSSPPAFPAKIVAWSKAIAVGEGATPESNNPGNLKYSGLTASWGAKQGRAATDGGYLCQFATPQAGQDALCNFLLLGCEDELIAFHTPEARTLGGFTKIYAGNPPQGYIDSIAAALAEPLSVQISTFLS
jgi:hypothetical protein